MNKSFFILGLLLAGCSSETTGTAIDPTTPSPKKGDTTEGGGTATATDPSVDVPSSGPSAGNKRAFVTSTEYSGYLTQYVKKGTTPEDAADAICQLSADALSLGGKYKAWIYTYSDKPIDRVTGDGPWYLLNGKKVFNNQANLSTKPLVTFDIDERGETVSYADKVWVRPCFASSDYSGSYTNVGDLTGQYSASCSETAHLYCFEE